MAGRFFPPVVSRGDRVASFVRPVAALAAVALFAAGCGDDDDNGDAGTTRSTNTSPRETAGVAELDAAAADFGELLDSTPEAIAEDVSALGLTPVTADQVRDVARALCGSTFDPHVTTSWLQDLILTNVAMVGPANRLFRYAAAPEVCTRGPTTYERDFYQAEVYRVLEPTPPLPPGATRVPNRVEAVVCDLLDAQSAQSDVVGSALNSLLALASRGRLDAGEFLPFVVEAAGAGCDQWLPTAVEVMDRHFNS
jgi:hypothetical protein